MPPAETGKFRGKAGRREKPLPVDGNPRTVLAARLRELKSACGNPTYEELARLSRIYKTGLLDAAGVTRLPPWYVIEGYVEGCWKYREGRFSAPFPDTGDLSRWRQLYRDAGGAIPGGYPPRETGERDEQPEPQLVLAHGDAPAGPAAQPPPPAARPPARPPLRLILRPGRGWAGLALGLLCLVALAWPLSSPSRPVTSPPAARCAYVTALPAPVLSAPSTGAALVKREDLGDGIEILPLPHPPGWWPVHTPGSHPDHNWMPAGALSQGAAGTRPCPDKAVTAITTYNSDSAEEQFAVGSDCRVYHRWQTAAGGQFSPWSGLGGCASARQGLAVGMNGDGELVAFVISPDHAVRYKSQSRPSLGPWTSRWVSIGGDVSTALRVVSAPGRSSPIRVLATDKNGNLRENDQTQDKGNCCWTGWRTAHHPSPGALRPSARP